MDPRPRRLHALPGLDLRRPGRHGDTDRQRADRARGAPDGRGHAQRPQHLDAVRHDPGRAGRRDRRPGQPHPQRRPPGRADPPGTVPSGRDGRAGTERATVAADAGGGPPRRGDRRARAPARRSPWGSAGPANRRPGRPGPDRGLPGRGDRRAAIRPPGGRPSPAGGPRRLRAHRRHHRRPEDRRPYPRQPARLRPRHRRGRGAGCRGSGAGRAAVVPRQRADRHRHRPDVRRPPGGVAGPGGLPRPRPVRRSSGRSCSTTGSRPCPPSPPSTAP